MPSNKILAAKQQQLEALVSKMKAAQGGVLVNYTGITVEQDTALRTELRKAGVEYKVYKNTMTALACDQVGFTQLKDQLTGMTALATCATDPIAPAKILASYAEKIPTFEIKAGFVDGAVVDAAAVNALSKIPSKEILISKLLGSIQSPLYKFAYAIKAITEKEGGEATEAPAEA